MRTQHVLFLGLAVLLLGGCGSNQPIPTAKIAQFSLVDGGSHPREIVAGPDGNLWFTEYVFNRIGRITPNGAITEFPLLLNENDSYEAAHQPYGIVAGPDGNIWFTEGLGGNAIGRISPAGVITEFPLATPFSFPRGITVGPDGNLWFAEETNNVIGRITTAGVITEFPAQGNPLEITTGANGNLWFTEKNANQIGRMTPQGVLTQFPIPTANSTAMGIVAGPDGNVWFTENDGNRIGRITPQGKITEFTLPHADSWPRGITKGPMARSGSPSRVPPASGASLPRERSPRLLSRKSTAIRLALPLAQTERSGLPSKDSIKLRASHHRRSKSLRLPLRRRSIT